MTNEKHIKENEDQSLVEMEAYRTGEEYDSTVTPDNDMVNDLKDIAVLFKSSMPDPAEIHESIDNFILGHIKEKSREIRKSYKDTHFYFPGWKWVAASAAGLMICLLSFHSFNKHDDDMSNSSNVLNIIVDKSFKLNHKAEPAPKQIDNQKSVIQEREKNHYSEVDQSEEKTKEILMDFTDISCIEVDWQGFAVDSVYPENNSGLLFNQTGVISPAGFESVKQDIGWPANVYNPALDGIRQISVTEVNSGSSHMNKSFYIKGEKYER
jgi:hypothetical protein